MARDLEQLEKITTSMRLTRPDLRKYKAYAANRGMTLSDIVNEALEAYCAANPLEDSSAENQPALIPSVEVVK